MVSSADYLLLSKNAFTDLARGHLLLERALFELLVRNESPPVLQMEGVPDVVLNEWQKTSKIEFLAQRPSDYERERERMTDWLLKLASRPGDQVTLISTNYDTEIEQALYVRLGYEVFDRVDFGMSVRDPLTGKVCRRPENVRLGVYKLHGSFNLLRCDLCDNAYVHVITAIAYLTYLFEDEARSVKKKHPWLEQLLHSGAHQCHCGYPLLRHMIVAPSFVRDVRDPNLLEIWHNALEALRQADEWIIVGYSLPPEDVAIRSILLRAYQGRDTGRPPQITVVQKAETEPELTRYRLLIPGHKYVAGGFSGYLDSLDRSSP